MGLLLFLLGVAQAYFRSKAVVDETGTVIKSLPSDRTERLDVLLNRIRSLQNPPFFVFGMDRSAKLLEPVERLYLQQLFPIVQSSYLYPLQQRLRDPRRKQSDLSEDLKAYLLLTTEHERLNEDTLNQVFLSDELSKTIDPSTSTSLNHT